MRARVLLPLAIVAGGLVGLGAAQIVDLNGRDAGARTAASSQAQAPTPIPRPPEATATATATPAGLRRGDLARLVTQVATRTGGRVSAAVIADTLDAPIAAASAGSLGMPFRMWSVSKAATAIALLEAHGDARLPADTRGALDNALVGSGDCAQRQMTVELQELTGGAAAARARIQSVLDRAGARNAVVLDREAVAGPGCRPYLEQRSRIPDPYRSALQVGTAEWTVRDAARFALALGDGTYSARITTRMLALLRKPKRRSDDPFAHGLDVTTTPAWGAGLALDGLDPAYKAGWGGSSGETPTFVNEQAIFVEAGGHRYGIAVTFEPPDIPIRDDPALTAAPRAFRLLLTGIRRRLAL